MCIEGKLVLSLRLLGIFSRPNASESELNTILIYSVVPNVMQVLQYAVLGVVPFIILFLIFPRSSLSARKQNLGSTSNKNTSNAFWYYPDFENHLDQMYPIELEIKDSTGSNISASFDLDLL